MLEQALQNLGYEILEYGIGGGAFGIVHKVRKLTTNRIYIAKTLRDEHIRDESMCHLFNREADLCVNIKPDPEEMQLDVMQGYKHIALLESKLTIALPEPQGGIRELTVLVMEYVDGITLKKLIYHEKYLSTLLTVKFAIQFCNGMIYCATKRPGFIHRDIKPHNIMVTRDKCIKIIDLGISKSLGFQTGFTMDMIGTPAYMAPELLYDEEEANFKTDIYAFGVTLKELITGSFSAAKPKGKKEFLEICKTRKIPVIFFRSFTNAATQNHTEDIQILRS